MLSDNAKRNISFGVFGFGIFAGLWGCGVSVQAIFTIGGKDTLPEIIALLLAFDTPWLICMIALRHRRFAGWWLVFAGLFFPFGLFYQRVSNPSPDDLLLPNIEVSLLVSIPLLAVGLFGVLTERAGWPKLLGGSLSPID